MQEKFRKDYQPANYTIQEVDLTFKIFERFTQVISDNAFRYVNAASHVNATSSRRSFPICE